MQNSSDVSQFHEDLTRVLKRLSSKHNVSIPTFNVVDLNSAYYVQFCAHKGSPQAFFTKTYLENKDHFGLYEEWLNKTFENKNTGKFLTLQGMDLSLGERCLRLVDQEGVEYSMSPDSFIIMAEQLGH